MRKPVTAFLSLAIFLILALSSVPTVNGQGQYIEEIHKSFTIPSDGRISLENINGDVRVQGWDRNEVKIDAIKRAYREERLREVDVQISADSGSVRIKSKYSSNNLTWNDNGFCQDCNPATVEYTLMVPRGARIDKINVVNSSIDIEDLAGSVDASSVNGRVKASKLYGETRLSTVNGKLEADFAGLRDSQRVSLGSVNGSVVLFLPFAANAEITASTVHGGISNDFGFEAERGRYVGRSLSGVLGDGGSRITLNNVNGSIAIRREGNSSGKTSSDSMFVLRDKGATVSTKTLSDGQGRNRDALSRSRALLIAKQEKLDHQRATIDGQIASIDNLCGVLAEQWNISPEEKRVMDAERTVLEAERAALLEVRKVLDKQKASLAADLVALDARISGERESSPVLEYVYRPDGGKRN